MVTLLALFLGAVLLYAMVWRPLSDWSNAADASYQHQIALLDWMRQHESEARAAAARADATPESGSLLTLVANSAARSGLQLLRYQPEGAGGVSVVLQNQSFNALVSWIAELEQGNHVSVKQISIDGQSDPGLVNARVILI
jgi:general secretion pathway protein M